MAIITISRGSASGGLLLATGLSTKLGYRFISREELLKEAAKYGVEEAKLTKGILGPPVFSEDFKYDLKCYLAFVQEVFCEWAQEDNIIYLGHAGHLLIPGVSHVIRMRLIAPLSYRIRTLVERKGMTEEQAAAYIEKVDAQRRAWTLLIYGVDWLNPSLYDLTINLETLSIESAIEIAAAAASRSEFEATPQSLKAVKDVWLASRIKVALASAPTTTLAKIEVQADSLSGSVILKGGAQPRSMIDEAIRIAGGVDGVEKVDGSQLDASGRG